MKYPLDNYLDLFKRNGGAINRPYKNYEKGYVNKVITIGTPHFGSPVADIINRYVSGLPLTVRLTLSTFSGFQNGERTFPFMFIKQDGNSPWYSPQFVATDAVKNLQINSNTGGVNFQQAYIRAHVIAGDIIPGRQLNLPGGLIPQSLIDQVANMGNNYLERFVNYLLNYAVAHETDPVINAAAINALSKSEPIDRALTFLENLTMVLDVANYGTFMPESDLIVGVGSQTAGFTEIDPNVSIVDNFVAHAIIHSETKNLDIGNYVMQQLNTPINSSAFNLLPATPSTPAFPFANQISLTSTVSNADTLIAKTDTNRIIIVQPINNSSVTVDNLITVRVNIKDTLNLKTINLYFQDKTYKLAKTIGIINLQLQVSSNAIGNQKISVEGFYDYQDSSVLAIDDKNLNILNHESINSFSVSPEIIHLSVGEKSSASFVALFQTFTISSSSLNNSLIITVNDTNIIRFDTTTHEFYAKKIGETFATIGYLGLIDTIYFVVIKGAENSLAAFSSSSQRICNGTSISYLNQSFGSPLNIKWNFPGGNPATSTDNNPIVTYNTPGLYNVLLIATYTDKVDTLIISNYVTVDTCQSLLSIKVFIDGYYLGSNQMKAVLSNLSPVYPSGSCDSIFLEFHTPEYPYPTDYITNALLDINGIASFMIPNNMIGKLYFISIIHHKSLAVWTSAPITITSTPLNFNFTTSSNLAYGNNMRQLPDGKYAFYSGDIDQNGFIEMTDIIHLEDECQLHSVGYSMSDLSGDAIIESVDYSIIENNLGKFIMKP